MMIASVTAPQCCASTQTAAHVQLQTHGAHAHAQMQGRMRSCPHRTAVLMSAGRLGPDVERAHQRRSSNSNANGGGNSSGRAVRQAVRVPQLLASTLSAASTIEDLHRVVTVHESHMDASHVARALARAATLYSPSPSSAAAAAAAAAAAPPMPYLTAAPAASSTAAAPLLAMLTRMAVQRARHASPHSLVATAAALGRLQAHHVQRASSPPAGQQPRGTTRGAVMLPAAASSSQGIIAPNQQQLTVLAQRAVELLPALDMPQLAVLLWGLARAGLQRPGKATAWLAPLLDAALDRYDLAHLAQQQAQDVQAGIAAAPPQQQQQQQAVAASVPPLQCQPSRPQQGAAAAAAGGAAAPGMAPAAAAAAAAVQQVPLLSRPVRLPGANAAAAATAQQLPQPPLPPLPLQLPVEQQQLIQQFPTLQQQQQQVPSHSHSQQHHSLATDLALLIHALATMDVQPAQVSTSWLPRWQAAVLQQLPAANAQDLAQVLWGVASLKLHPGRPWTDLVLQASRPLLQGADSQALSNILWAASRLAHPDPPPGWTDDCLAALTARQGLGSSPAALSTCLAALARLHVRPEPTWLAQALTTSASTLRCYNGRQMTSTLWALASLGARPSEAWLKELLAAAAAAADAGRLDAPQLGSLLWSLALLRRPGGGGSSSGSGSMSLAPQEELHVQALLAALPHAAAASGGSGFAALGARGCSALAWSLAALGVRPPKQWLWAFLSGAFADGTLADDAPRCAGVLFSLASLDMEGLVEWLSDFLAGSGGPDGRGADDASAIEGGLQRYATLAGVLGTLGEMEGRELRAAWLEQSHDGLDWSAEASNSEPGLGGTGGMPLAGLML